MIREKRNGMKWSIDWPQTEYWIGFDIKKVWLDCTVRKYVSTIKTIYGSALVLSKVKFGLSPPPPSSLLRGSMRKSTPYGVNRVKRVGWDLRKQASTERSRTSHSSNFRSNAAMGSANIRIIMRTVDKCSHGEKWGNCYCTVPWVTLWICLSASPSPPGS